MKGIDVSTLQGVVDFAKVRAAGYEFAMIKATQGRGEGVTTRLLRRFTDGKFKRNIEAAAKAGLACGVYHYMTAKSEYEAIEEAEYFCSIIAPYRDCITLWAAVDVESEMYLSKIGQYELARIVEQFMLTVEKRGFKPMLYTNPNYIKYRLPDGAFNISDIWLAHYNVAKPMAVPNTRIWQKGTDRVPGVNGVCDVNEGYFPPVIPAICRLATLGVIDGPMYWCEHYGDDPYLDELITKSEAYINSNAIRVHAEPLAFEAALGRLVSVGIVNTPEYWRTAAYKKPYIPDLICKLGGAV